MRKEILLYNIIYSSSAERFITTLEENKNNDISLRLNTDGGNPEDGWGMIAKFAEHKKKKAVKVDGKAYSWGAFFLCFTDEAEALDVSQFLFHRAAYSAWFEKSEYMTPEKWDNLNKINKGLRAALESKIDVKAFEKLKSVTMDEIFSNDSRIDVFFDAEEALKIGLITKINSITPEKKAEINTLMLKVAAGHIVTEVPATEEPSSENLNSNIMTKEEFKAKHPDAYAAIVKEGIDAERDRVGALMVYNDIDPETVAKKVKDGSQLSQTDMAELGRKAFSKEALKNITADSTKEVKTDEVSTTVKTEDEKKVEAFAAEVRENLGLTK
jgi:ATP-dependent protease ClpP protease subunit